MSRADVEELVLKPMQAAFYPKRDMPDADLAPALRTYADVLEGYERIDLQKGWANSAGKWGKDSWPTPNFILTEVKRARADRLPAGRNSELSHFGRPSYSVLHKRWLDVRGSQLAIDAAAAGVAFALKSKILYSAVLPEEVDIGALVIAKRAANITMVSIRDNEQIPWHGRFMEFSETNRDGVLRLWAIVQQHEAETQEEIAAAWRVRDRPAMPTLGEPLDAYWNREQGLLT